MLRIRILTASILGAALLVCLFSLPAPWTVLVFGAGDYAMSTGLQDFASVSRIACGKELRHHGPGAGQAIHSMRLRCGVFGNGHFACSGRGIDV